jgi:hypothetical protein
LSSGKLEMSTCSTAALGCAAVICQWRPLSSTSILLHSRLPCYGVPLSLPSGLIWSRAGPHPFATGEGDLEDKAGVNDLVKAVRHTDAGNCIVAPPPYSVRLPRQATGGGWSWIRALHGFGAGSDSRPDLNTAAVIHWEKVERRKRRKRKGWVAGMPEKECFPFTFYTLCRSTHQCDMWPRSKLDPAA